MMKYIHYGCNSFDINKFLPIINQEFDWTKPKQGGFWASEIKSEYGWRQWCKDEDFHIDKLNKYFLFDLSSKARICHLKSYNDLKKLPELQPIVKNPYYKIDFEASMKQYDAIQLHLSEDRKHNIKNHWESLYFKLYGWDCDSILIMNPSIIIY